MVSVFRHRENALRYARVLLRRPRVEISQCKPLTIMKCKGTKTSQRLELQCGIFLQS